MPDVIDLVVPNIAEFNLRHPKFRFDPSTVDAFTRFGRTMADAAVFWSRAPRVLVLPEGTDRTWLADVHRGLAWSVPPVIEPRLSSGLVTRDLLADPTAMVELRQVLAGHRRVRLVSWGASPDLYRLCDAVRAFGLDVELDVPAERDYWSSLYLDSKVSCLDLALSVPGVRVVPGVTVDTWEELRGAVRLITGRGRPVIVRGVYGSAGEGSAVAGPDPGSVEAFWRTVRDDPLLQVFPLLVQPYLKHQEAFGSPAVDMLVAGAGEPDPVADLVPSVMTVDVHRFVHVDVGAEVLPAAVTGEMVTVSRRVASAVRDLGFQGWFGIDFIVDRVGDLYVTEFNARRTGGTQWMPLLDQWHPDRRAVAHARHAVPLPAGAPAGVTYGDLRPVFEAAQNRGVVVHPTAIRGLAHPRRPSYGIVTRGADAAEAGRHADDVIRAVEALFSGARPVGAGVDGGGR